MPRNPTPCSVPDCTRAAAKRGWCNAHYIRWRKTGDPSTPKSYWQRPPTVFPGDRFRRLVVVKGAEKRVRAKERAYLCWCNCGRMVRVGQSALRSGNTKSCGCLRDEKVPWGFATTHGHTWTDEAGKLKVSSTYSAWQAMSARCRAKEGQRFWEWYGARGITVHPSWRGTGGFEQFLADMGEKPAWATGGLDRIDVNGNYESGNCRWATRVMQAQNKRPQARLSEVAELRALVENQRQEIARLKGA